MNGLLLDMGADNAQTLKLSISAPTNSRLRVPSCLHKASLRQCSSRLDDRVYKGFCDSSVNILHGEGIAIELRHALSSTQCPRHVMSRFPVAVGTQVSFETLARPCLTT